MNSRKHSLFKFYGIFFMILLFSATSSFSQTQKFNVRLILDINEGDLTNVWVTITKGGATYRTINPNKSKYLDKPGGNEKCKESQYHLGPFGLL